MKAARKDQQRNIEFFLILGIPVLFAAYGLLRWRHAQRRRARTSRSPEPPLQQGLPAEPRDTRKGHVARQSSSSSVSSSSVCSVVLVYRQAKKDDALGQPHGQRRWTSRRSTRRRRHRQDQHHQRRQGRGRPREGARSEGHRDRRRRRRRRGSLTKPVEGRREPADRERHRREPEGPEGRLARSTSSSTTTSGRTSSSTRRTRVHVVAWKGARQEGRRDLRQERPGGPARGRGRQAGRGLGREGLLGVPLHEGGEGLPQEGDPQVRRRERDAASRSRTTHGALRVHEGATSGPATLNGKPIAALRRGQGEGHAPRLQGAERRGLRRRQVARGHGPRQARGDGDRP